jgi:hypothetical protein
MGSKSYKCQREILVKALDGAYSRQPYEIRTEKDYREGLPITNWIEGNDN